MSNRRNFGRSAEKMRAALEQYDRDELLDLLTHVMRVYVIEGEQDAEPDAQISAPLETLKGLSFAQVILHLKMNLPHEQLQRIHVSGERVWVEGDDAEVELTSPAPAEVPPDADMIERESPTYEAGSGAFSARDLVQHSEGESAVTGPVDRAPQEAELPPGTPRRRPPHRSAGQRAAEDAGRVARPDVGLRNQPTETRRPPPPSRDDGPGQRSFTGEDEKGVGETSDRFSMLEFD